MAGSQQFSAAEGTAPSASLNLIAAFGGFAAFPAPRVQRQVHRQSPTFSKRLTGQELRPQRVD